MLDEYLEYKEYQFSHYKKVDHKTRYRIRSRYLKKRMTSVPRALEIIARENLFCDKHMSVDSVKNSLFRWLNHFKNPKYLKFIGISDTQEFLEIYSKFREHYVKASTSIKINGCKLKVNIDDLNTSFWDRTIANAYERGPLRRYMLVENKDIFDNVYKKGERGPERSLKNDTNMEAHKDLILKFTAYYLLQNPLNQKSVSLSKYPVFNWSMHADGVRYYWKFRDGTTIDLFERLTKFDQLSKYTAYEPWISNFSIYDITDAGSLDEWKRNPENRGKHYYLDKGAFEYLERHSYEEA